MGGYNDPMQLTVQAPARARWAPLLRVGLAARLLVVTLAGCVVLVTGEQPRELRVRQAAAPHAFVLLDWEVARLWERAGRIGAGLVGRRPSPEPERRAAVSAYFGAAPADREPLRANAEAAIEAALHAHHGDAERHADLPPRPFAACCCFAQLHHRNCAVLCD